MVLLKCNYSTHVCNVFNYFGTECSYSCLWKHGNSVLEISQNQSGCCYTCHELNIGRYGFVVSCVGWCKLFMNFKSFVKVFLMKRKHATLLERQKVLWKNSIFCEAIIRLNHWTRSLVFNSKLMSTNFDLCANTVSCLKFKNCRLVSLVWDFSF